MYRRLFYIYLVFSCFLTVGCLSDRVKTGKPNFLFILSDDHTTNAISCYNSRLADYAQTVNIDKLAEEGIRFENFFCTNSICSPSRATILTGKYSHENGVYCLGQEFDTSQVTFPKLLHDNGYQTGLFGKWHLKSTPSGFDDYKVLRVQGRYQDPEFIEKGSDSLIIHRGWSTDIITQMTMDFISKRDPGKPFIAFCQYKTTHDPWASRPPYDTALSNVEIPVPDNFYDDYENRSEAAKRTTLKLEFMNQSTFPHKRLKGAGKMEQRKYIYQQYIKAFLRCGMVLDENIGRLVKFLEDEGLLDNTVIVYTADQGHFLGEHGFFSKRFMYDESMRTPLIIKMPGKDPYRGVNEDLLVNIDLAPTILKLAGIQPEPEMQGEDFSPILYGGTPEFERNGVYYHYWQHLLHRDVAAHYGIRTKDFKLIFYYGLPLGQTEYDPTPPEWEFFDLHNDPHEMVNLYSVPEYKSVIDSLKNELLYLKKQIGDQDSKYPELQDLHSTQFNIQQE